MDPTMDLDKVISDFACLKISAISKSIKINRYVDEVTIGPNSKISPKKYSPSYNRIVAPDTADAIKTKTNESPKPNILRPQSVNIIHSVLSSLEKNRKELEAQCMEQHHKRLALFRQEQEAKRLQSWKEHQAQKLLEIQNEEEKILQAMQQVEEESEQEFARATAKAKQRHAENEQKIKAKVQEQQQLIKLKTECYKVEQDIILVIKDVDLIIKNHPEAKIETAKSENEFKQLVLRYKAISDKMKRDASPVDLKMATDLLRQVTLMKDGLRIRIKDYYQRREREAAAKVATQKRKEEEAKAQQQINAQTPPSTPAAATPTSASDIQSEFDQDIKDQINHYIELQTFLHMHQQSYKQLQDDPAYKQFKFDCKKAVNIPVNAISAVSRDHLRDKYVKLHNLLSGKTVEISDRRVNATQHPHGVAFVTDLLAKKFVLQGDLTISGNPEAAFAYGTIIVTLWNDFPTFGKLLLAHFHKECPYLVPFVFEKQRGQSDEQFYTSMGYQYKDGVVEKQDKFLKRMAGIAKLFFSIMISHTKAGTAHNPHSLYYAWVWIARTLNKDPHMDITATLLHGFLEVLGYDMERTYGAQFKKLLVYMAENTIPLLKGKDSGGPLARLEGMLQEYFRRRSFEKPKGTLSEHFW